MSNAKKWEASERAADRAMRLANGIAGLKFGTGGTGVCDVGCASPEQAQEVANITGGKVVPQGHGYAANTVLVKG